jgi:hypothetical protein
VDVHPIRRPLWPLISLAPCSSHPQPQMVPLGDSLHLRDHRDFGREYDTYTLIQELLSDIFHRHSGQEDYGPQCLQNGTLQTAVTGLPTTLPF